MARIAAVAMEGVSLAITASRSSSCGTPPPLDGTQDLKRPEAGASGAGAGGAGGSEQLARFTSARPPNRPLGREMGTSCEDLLGRLCLPSGAAFRALLAGTHGL